MILKVVNPSGIPSSSHCIRDTSLAIGFGTTLIRKDEKAIQPEPRSSILTNMSVGVGAVFV